MKTPIWNQNHSCNDAKWNSILQWQVQVFETNHLWTYIPGSRCITKPAYSQSPQSNPVSSYTGWITGGTMKGSGVSVLTLCSTLSMASQLTICTTVLKWVTRWLMHSFANHIGNPSSWVEVKTKQHPTASIKNCTTGCCMYYPFTFDILPALYLHHYVLYI